MNQRQAKRAARAMVSDLVAMHVEPQFGEEQFPDKADRDKVHVALLEIADEMARRSGR